MNIDRFKADHDAILVSITQLRALVQAGVVVNAAEIAQAIVNMSAKIKVHLAAEDASLYPQLAKSPDPKAVRLAQGLQAEMGHLAKAYGAFASKWNVAQVISSDPETFRREASDVFKALAHRIKVENGDLYPLAESC